VWGFFIKSRASFLDLGLDLEVQGLQLEVQGLGLEVQGLDAELKAYNL